MSTLFPTDLDQYGPVPRNQALAVKHHDRHQNVEDAIEAIEGYLGTSASADPTTISYKVNQILGPGGSSLIGFTQEGTGAVALTVQDKARERVSVLDFIPGNLHASIRDGSNTTDLLAYIDAALVAADAFGKTELIFPAGDYRVSGQVLVLQNQLTIRGEGRARLVSTSATAHILVIGDGVANPGNIKVTGLAFTSTVQKSAGAAVYVRNGNDIRLADIICAVNLWDGVVFEGGAAQFGYYLDGYLATFFRGDGIRQQIGGGVNIQDVHVSSALIDATPGQSFGAVGIRLLSGGGTYYRYVDILGGANSIVTLPPVGSAVNYSFFDQIIADTAQGDCWDLHDAGGNVLGWTMSNCWGNTSVNGHGFRSRGTGAGKIRHVQISNSIFANNELNGMLLDRTDQHKIVGCTIAGNNTSNTAGMGGISLAAGCSNFIIDSNTIDNEWFFGIGSNQKFAVQVAAGASDNYTITGNMSRLNAATWLDGGTGTNKNTTGNVPALTTFIAPTLLNSWVNFGGTWENAGYWKDENNIVHLHGSIKSGTVPAALFNLPAGYIPAADHAFAVICGTNLNAVAGITVKSGGAVECTTGASNVILCLDGISFKAG